MRLGMNKVVGFGYVVVLVLLFLWVLTASAETVSFTWTNATTDINGDPIEIATTHMMGSPCVGGDYDAGTAREVLVVDYPVAQASYDETETGEWCYRAFHRSVAGVDSELSNLATRTVVPPQPAPPSSLQTQETLAYGVYKVDGPVTGEFRLSVVGTVAEGTECNPEQTVNGYNAVPVSAVTFTDPAREESMLLVVARCG